MKSLKEIREDACKHLTNRQQYARDVVWGRALWSGADLRGNAKRWSNSYRIQRDRAKAAFFAAGGVLVAYDYGRIISAAPAGTLDGREVYETDYGWVVKTESGRVKRLPAANPA